MQNLLVEFQNTPIVDTPQVPCSVIGVLNRDKSLSVPCKVLANNNSKEDQYSGKSGQDLRVPVINMQNQLISDNARNSEQVGIPAGLDWIKTLFLLYNFKRCEVLQFLLLLKEVGILAQI